MIANSIFRGFARTRPGSTRVLRLAQAPRFARPSGPAIAQRRLASSRSAVDAKIEEIQELYGTAKDEFDIAIEETEKQTVYAEEDRQAAREELDKLNAAFKEIMDGPDTSMADEIRKRVGQRIRELVTAVERMEEQAQNQD